jgi:hypothetical protein
MIRETRHREAKNECMAPPSSEISWTAIAPSHAGVSRP